MLKVAASESYHRRIILQNNVASEIKTIVGKIKGCNFIDCCIPLVLSTWDTIAVFPQFSRKT